MHILRQECISLLVSIADRLQITLSSAKMPCELIGMCYCRHTGQPEIRLRILREQGINGETKFSLSPPPSLIRDTALHCRYNP
jgi:hypothetical protein